MSGVALRGLGQRVAPAAALTAMAIWLVLLPAVAAAAAPVDAPDVEVVREHLFLTRGPAGAQVLHTMDLVNLGPRPAQRVPLPVPAAAQWEEVPAPIEVVDGGLVDPRPLGVGEQRQYALIYILPWREPMVLRRPLLYPTEDLWLWAETSGLQLRGVGLVPVGQEVIEGVEFSIYHMERLSPHPAWQVVLERPGAGADRLPVLMQVGMRSDPAEVLAHHPLPRLLLAVLVVGAVVAGVRWVRSRPRAQGALGSAGATEGRRGASGTGVGVATSSGEAARAGSGAAARGAAAPAPGDAVRHEVERLKDEIVQLDVAFHNGELDEDVYQERRARLKARLLHLSRGRGGASR